MTGKLCSAGVAAGATARPPRRRAAAARCETLTPKAAAVFFGMLCARRAPSVIKHAADALGCRCFVGSRKLLLAASTGWASLLAECMLRRLELRPCAPIMLAAGGLKV